MSGGLGKGGNAAVAGGESKAYQPSVIEPRVTERWASSGAFHPDPARVLSGEAEPYSMVIPPPNVTGALHLGHALNNTLQDILTRAHRMKGFETLWMPGTDHAGIATQAVVEKRLLKEEGKRRKDFTREEFIARVQAWKDEYEARITGQLKAMGCSCDFERQRFTMDDVCARAVREAFFQLFKDGLIYRGKRLVNWDPALQTAVADDECYEEELDAHFYYLRYPLVHAQQGPQAQSHPQPVTWNELERRGYPHASEHPGEQQAWVTVATTRPETYLGDTAVAVNPKDPRAKALRGLLVELPLVGRVIPILEDDYVVLPARFWEDPDEAIKDPKAMFATGFLKVTPAHDANDYDLGMRHKAAIEALGNPVLVNVMAPDATISDKFGWSNEREIKGAHVFLGLTREAARKKVIDEFKARTVGDSAGAGGYPLFEGTKPYRHSVKHSDRSKAIVEPYLSDQWFVKVTDDRLSGAANRALVPEQRSGDQAAAVGKSKAKADAEGSGDGSMRFYPARYAKTYEQWHDNIRDWCISRQLWWGHRIPVWSHPRFSASAWTHEFAAIADDPDIAGMNKYADWNVERVFNESDSEVLGTAIPTEPFFLCIKPGRPDLEQILQDAGFTQDPDVLDTWFSSALWPLSTMGWPEPSQSSETKGLLDAFNPTSVLSTAREIITLWVSRMVMMNRYLLGTPPLRGGGIDADTNKEPPRRAGVPDAGRGNGPVPFHDVFIHAVVQDGEGRKMSKSLGNGVDPLDIIETHGADAMRFVLCQMTTQTQDVRMPVVKDAKTGKNTSAKFDAGRNFCNKLWNASKFAMTFLPKDGGASAKPIDPKSLSLVDRWMLSRLAQTTAAVDKSLKSYEFSDYAEAVYRLLWWDVCDWYLEAIKPTVASSPEQQAVLAHALEVSVRLLHPVTPFVTEAVWEQLRQVATAPIKGLTLGGSSKGDLLATAGWPEIDASLVDAEAEKQFDELKELVNAIRNVRSEHQVPPKRKVTLHASKAATELMALSPGFVETLAGIEKVEHAPPAKDAASVVLRALGTEMLLSNLADAIDAGAEKERLTKQLDTLVKSEAALAGRLNNPGYVDRAPAKLVEESKAQLAKIQDEIKAVRERLKTL